MTENQQDITIRDYSSLNNDENYYENKVHPQIPDMTNFLQTAVNTNLKTRSQIKQNLESVGITKVTDLYTYNASQLANIAGISDLVAQKIVLSISKLKRGGSILMNVQQLRQIESQYQYLPIPSSSLQKMLTYSNSRSGVRSSTLVEIYGEASVGKTQLCMTLAAMVMLPVENGGWGKGVVYIDTEGSFEYSRFVYLARYWGVDLQFIEENLLVAKVSNFDEVEAAIDEANTCLQNQTSDIGIIVIDSIMDPLKAQYPISGSYLNNLQPRQAHLKRVTDQLKAVAQNFNIVGLYTNHVRAAFGTSDQNEDHNDKTTNNKMIAQGGNVMAHASDIRIELQSLSIAPSLIPIEKLDEIKKSGINIARASVVDCGFLPRTSGVYLVGPMGIADPDNWDIILYHTKQINLAGYICINSLGEKLDPLFGEIESDKNVKPDSQNDLYSI